MRTLTHWNTQSNTHSTHTHVRLRKCAYIHPCTLSSAHKLYAECTHQHALILCLHTSMCTQVRNCGLGSRFRFRIILRQLAFSGDERVKHAYKIHGSRFWGRPDIEFCFRCRQKISPYVLWDAKVYLCFSRSARDSKSRFYVRFIIFTVVCGALHAKICLRSQFPAWVKYTQHRFAHSSVAASTTDLNLRCPVETLHGPRNYASS